MEPHKPVRYIFAGLPDSAKSTIAQLLRKQRKITYLRVGSLAQPLRDLTNACQLVEARPTTLENFTQAPFGVLLVGCKTLPPTDPAVWLWLFRPEFQRDASRSMGSSRAMA